MNNMCKFTMVAFLIMLMMNVILGLLFCLATGSMTLFVPFIEFGLIIAIIYCVSIALLSKA